MFRKNTYKNLSVLAILFVYLTSYNDKYPEPVYYIQEHLSSEDVVIKHSRNIHYNVNGIRFKTAALANKKYSGMTIEKIDYVTSWKVYLEGKKAIKIKMDSIINSIR